MEYYQVKRFCPKGSTVGNLVEKLDNRFYPGITTNWDDALFREEILSVLEPSFRVLDIGAGAGIVEQMNFRRHVASMVGIDLDERVLENPWLDEAHHGDATKTPFKDKEFDLIFCDNVLEHIAEPEAFMAEVTRILKPGGLFMGKTPNKNHYMPLIARLTPLWFHRFYNKLRGRESEDTFPTCYRLNSIKDLKTQSRPFGFTMEKGALFEGRPEYLRISALTYLPGILYERLVNNTPFLKRFSILLIVTLRLDS